MDSKAASDDSVSPTSTISKPRYASMRTRFLAYVLIIFVILSTYPSFDTGYSLKDIRYLITPLPNIPMERALAIIRQYPIIDTHIDLPILTRAFYRNQLSEITLREGLRGQVDIPRLRKGVVGGFVHSVYVPCPEDAGYSNQNDGNFTESTWRVRDTLEQIDIARLIIEKFSDVFALTTNVKSWRRAMKQGKVAGFLGVEGGHQLGNSLSTLRMYFALGVRYVTITHTCNNAFGDSCGMQGTPIAPRWGGLSPFGRTMVKEANRIGMILDLSHTAPATASEVLSLSLSPPIFSHSNARGVLNVVRNLPDSILCRIGQYSTSKSIKICHNLDGEGGRGWGNNTGESQKEIRSGDVIISLNFSPDFISTTPADIEDLADHADYIGRLAGRDMISIGSDFDGIARVPEGLDDVSKYPHLIAALISRGWSDSEIIGLTSENFLRVWGKVEKAAYQLRQEAPETEIFDLRTDMKRRDHY